MLLGKAYFDCESTAMIGMSSKENRDKDLRWSGNKEKMGVEVQVKLNVGVAH